MDDLILARKHGRKTSLELGVGLSCYTYALDIAVDLAHECRNNLALASSRLINDHVGR